MQSLPIFPCRGKAGPGNATGSPPIRARKAAPRPAPTSLKDTCPPCRPFLPPAAGTDPNARVARWLAGHAAPGPDAVTPGRAAHDLGLRGQAVAATPAWRAFAAEQGRRLDRDPAHVRRRNEFVLKHERYIFGRLRRSSPYLADRRHRDELEDVFVDVVVLLLEKFSGFDGVHWALYIRWTVGRVLDLRHRRLRRLPPVVELTEVGWGFRRAAPDPAPFAAEDRRREAARLRAAVADLPERARNIVTARFNLDGGGEKKLRELAGGLGVSGERVRQVEASAMEKLAAALAN